MKFTSIGGKLLLGGSFALYILSSCGQKPQQQQSPYSPQEALSTFHLPDDYRIELVASEPLISDPVEVAFDEDGKMYVAQMDDYPSERMDDYGAGKEPKSKIMLLEDKDGDGFYESGSVFADGLPYANGVMPWKGGVLVTSAPDIFFLKDTDGDGKADVKKVVLTGFALTNPQLRMGSLRYGLDNWIYGAYSRAGGGKWRKEFEDKGNPLQFPENPTQELAKIFPGTNFRFQPEQFKIEPSGGMSQFGMSFDAFGNQFTDWNNVHVRHVVINDKYLASNPYLSVSNTMADISDHGNAAPVYSIAKDMLNLHESEMGHFTSACGICEYTGGLFTGKYANASFVCEPVSNLVHADILSAAGPTFKAQRAENEKEFLASTDSWFRPVNLTTGPDGALYVVDFYRKLVEHPDWLAMADSNGFYTHAGQLKESDFLEGNDKGRIYRIVPKTYKAEKNNKPVLSKASINDLVGYLANTNKWYRSNAQRLLVDRKDNNAIPLIKNLLAGKISAEGKIHALWTLDGLNALDDSILEKAFQDADAAVRKQAVLIGEKGMDNKIVFKNILNAASDPDAYVQFQVALTLGKVAKPGADVFAALQKIISTHIEDGWFQIAVLTGASENANQWYEAYKDFNTKNDAENIGKKAFLKRIASIVGAKYKESEMTSLVKMIAEVKDTGVVVAGLQGMAEGMKRNPQHIKLVPGGQQALTRLIADTSHNIKDAAIAIAQVIDLSPSPELSTIINKAKEVVGNDKEAIPDRVMAIKIMGLDPQGIPVASMDKLLVSGQSSDIQLAAANVLLKSRQPASADVLLSKWSALAPKVHDVVEAGFLSGKDRVATLMKAVENAKIKPEWISRNTQNRLLNYSDSTIKERAEKLFKSSADADRGKVIIDYNAATTVAGDAAKGKIVFKNVCSTCHSLEGVGVNFGPDIHSVSHQTKINLLTMILNPNNDIAAGYEAYTIETTDGNTVAGIIATENEENLVLKIPGGAEQKILKANIKSMSPMPVSLMPEGLESSISKDDMAALLEYIKTVK